MNHDSAAAKPHSLPAGGSGEHRGLGREVSEPRGEVRTFRWASTLALVAILGTMGFFYKVLDTFNEDQKDVRQSLGAIYQQTVALGERLDRQDERQDRQGKRQDRQDERLDRMDGRLRHVENGLVEVNGRLDQMDGRLRHVENGLVEVNGRLDRMDGRLANVEELLRVLVARSPDPS